MLTYSKIKDTPVPPEFIITKENLKDIPNPHPGDIEYANWGESLEKIFLPIIPSANHNFVYISGKQYAQYTGGSCTGYFCLGYTSQASRFTQAITGSIPHVKNKDHQEYLNFLLNPIISPYSWLMKPDTYKIRVDNKGNINSYYFLDNRTRAGYMGGLSILERVWHQHSQTNQFWDYWKEKDELPFAAFFLFTHSSYMNQTKEILHWYGTQIPYSTFDMFNPPGLNRSVSGEGVRARFSAPRLFQSTPNHNIYDKTYKTHQNHTPILKAMSGHNSDNLVWSSEIKEADAILTQEYEIELTEFVNANKFKKDSYNKIIQDKYEGKAIAEVIDKHPKILQYFNSLKTNEEKTEYNKETQRACHLYNKLMMEGIHNIIRKYTPQFYNEKVA